MEKDLSGKAFYSDRERSADVINGLAFNGRQIVGKDDLMSLDTQTGFWRRKLFRGRGRKAGKGLQRDLAWRTVFGVNFVIAGIENQEEIDYALPLRILLYDASDYEKQAAEIRKEVRKSSRGLTSGEYLYGFKKSSRLHPIVTFILYYGEEEWDGPRDLHGMLDFTDLPEEFSRFVQNYELYLVEVRKLEDTSIFHTDVRLVVDFIRYSKDKKKLRELVQQNPAYQDMEEDAFDLAARYADADALLQVKDYHMERGKVNMCQALNELMEDSRLEGRQEGRQEGILQGEERGEVLTLITLIQKKHRKGKSLNVIAEELEETEDMIQPIYFQVQLHPNEDRESIYKRLNK